MKKTIGMMIIMVTLAAFLALGQEEEEIHDPDGRQQEQDVRGAEFHAVSSAPARGGAVQKGGNSQISKAQLPLKPWHL